MSVPVKREAVADLWPRNLIARRGGLPAPKAQVTRPSTVDEVVAAMAWARESGLKVVAVGGRSGVCGAVDVAEDQLAVDLTGLDRVLEVNERDLFCHVQAGLRLGDLEAQLNGGGLTLGHHPASLALATVGGAISTRSSGQQSSRYGSIEDLLLGVRALFADGTDLPLRVLPRSAAGPALHQVLAGAEGGLAVIVEAALRISRLPAQVAGRGYAFSRLEEGLEAMREIAQRGLRPLVVRLYDAEDSMLQGVTDGFLLVAAAAGEPELAAAEARAISAICAGGRDLGVDPWERWLRHRDDLSAERLLLMLEPPGAVLETIEVAVPWSRAAGLHAEVKGAISERGLILCHFAHISGQGCCAYFTFASSAPGEAEALDLEDLFWDTVMQAARAHGCGISHHHGVGRARSAWIAGEQGAWRDAWERLRLAWDPDRLLNPNAVGGR